MRRTIAAVGLAAAVIVIAALLTTQCDQGPADPPMPGGLVAGGDAHAGVPTVVPGAPIGDPPIVPPADARAAEAGHIADGDSFDIRWSDSGETDEVRLVGLNAPERDDCFGPEARTALTELIDDRRLLVAGAGRDEFGRVLAEVWNEEGFVNLSLVAGGAALALSSDGDHADALVAAQQTAREEGRGLWSHDACAAAVTGSLAIAAIEFDAPGPDDENRNGEWIEIVNLGSAAVDLSGVIVRDESTRNRFGFPDGFELDAGASVVVRSGCGIDSGAELYWCATGPVWNNGGDTGFLLDSDGRIVDTFGYAGS